MLCSSYNNMSVKRAEVYYSGDVQGVGFRYTARVFASNYPNLSGYVKNLSDGRVELVAEGEEETIKAFLADIKCDLENHIGDVSINWLPPKGDFKDFRVRYN